MKLSFSQRIGKTPAVKKIQIESMDDDLRIGLWNVTMSRVSNLNQYNSYQHASVYDTFYATLWHNFFKLRTDSIPVNSNDFIREKFFTYPWFKVYDFIEFIAKLGSYQDELGHEFRGLPEYYNDVMEREFSGYRFIEGHIAPITNETEIQEIEQALAGAGQFSSLMGANVHLQSALEKISDRTNPDYRNSIKESISAVESVCKLICGDKKATLGEALKKFKGQIDIHPALESALDKLYGYTSDAGGIRHAMTEIPKPAFEDAKFMLVTCSAFVNLLISKADKSGIKL